MSGDLVDTVLAPYQFSGWNTQMPDRRLAMRLDDTDPVVGECLAAWDDVVKYGGDPDLATAVFYYNPAAVKQAPDWARADKFIKQIGNHHFYRG